MKSRFRDRDWSDPKWQEHLRKFEDNRQRNKIYFGICIAIIGIVWAVMIKFNIDFDLESNWPIVLFAIGLLLGLKSNFTNNAWWILWLIGGASMIHEYRPAYDQYLVPAAMIVAGVAMALRPKRKPCTPRFKMNKSITAESSLDIDVVFGGRKEIVTSREFVTGNISVSFGGCEINFMQADIAGDTAVLDLRVAFGGVEIAVPSHWQVRNEISPAFGSVEDERQIRTGLTIENQKTLILRGSCSFGSVEIQSI